jgi:hypothetical protein
VDGNVIIHPKNTEDVTNIKNIADVEATRGSSYDEKA